MTGVKRDDEHVGLPTAATIIHIEITGYAPDAARPEEMRKVLNDVAHALSNTVPIYSRDPESGQPLEIPGVELLEAKFSRGAHLLLTKTGKEYRGLTVRRGDMETAIKVLRRVQFVPEPPKAGTQ